MKLSQTQLSNIMSIAGLIMIIANQFGYVLEQNKIAFILSAFWSIGWTIYNYYQRYKKGDLSLAGIRK